MMVVHSEGRLGIAGERRRADSWTIDFSFHGANNITSTRSRAPPCPTTGDVRRCLLCTPTTSFHFPDDGSNRLHRPTLSGAVVEHGPTRAS